MNNLQHCINLFCSKRSKSTFPAIEGGKLLKYPRKIINFLEATEIQRIYMMFISPEEAYLNGMASREQFATLYKFILQQKK